MNECVSETLRLDPILPTNLPCSPLFQATGISRWDWCSSLLSVLCFHPASLQCILPSATRRRLLTLTGQITSLLCFHLTRRNSPSPPCRPQVAAWSATAPLASPTPCDPPFLPSLPTLQPLTASAPDPTSGPLHCLFPSAQAILSIIANSLLTRLC